jgi:hypothetical protein
MWRGPFYFMAPHERQIYEVLIAHEFTFDRARYTGSAKSADKERAKKRA